ncbi:hypothetical protein AAFC00_005948 [Neodothiora populina]|uniref:PIG-P domain-containing protein n=1 Tax=Neodothiora populina TaxID=2781224 RepID=A0ABR3P7T0_9PEZI
MDVEFKVEPQAKVEAATNSSHGSDTVGNETPKKRNGKDANVANVPMPSPQSAGSATSSTPIADSAKSSGPSSKHGGHKRSLSGSILSRLNFLRMQPDEAKLRLAPESDDMAIVEDDLAASARPESAMLLAQRVAKQRKRKGSLRKTALLGTSGRLRSEGRERRNSSLQSHRPRNVDEHVGDVNVDPAPTTIAHATPSHLPLRGSEESARPKNAPRPLSLTSPDLQMFPPTIRARSHEREEANLKLSLEAIQQVASPTSTHTTSVPSILASPILSPTSQSNTSTTDDDEALTLPDSTIKRSTMPSSSSYFPSQPSIQRRRSSKKPPSPLSAIPVNAYAADEEYEYGDTEWWGWVVLVVTWIVFVIGMGSCFGLWSWAWDVGETPYAPPELEDDPTLPIVGYYPALIILTGVMAWVWVVVAWVGMKYFKHAKMAGEDV